MLQLRFAFFQIVLLSWVGASHAVIINQSSFSGTGFFHTYNNLLSDQIYSSLGIQPESLDPARNMSGIEDTVIKNTFPGGLLTVTDDVSYLFSNISNASLQNSLQFKQLPTLPIVDQFTSLTITIDFPNILAAFPPEFGVNKVGGLLSAGGDVKSEWLVTIYDSTLSPIESAMFAQPALESAVFWGFESTSDIARVTIEKEGGSNGFYTFLDDLRYENVSPIPIPAAAWLFGTALIALVGLSRRMKAS